MPGMSLQELLVLPWTWQGPKRVADEDGVRWELTIAELRDYFLVGDSPEAVLTEAWPALVAYLYSYTDRGEQPPVPQRAHTWRVVPPSVGEFPPITAPAPELQPA